MNETEQLVQEFVEIFLAGDKDKGIDRAGELLAGVMAPQEFFQEIFSPAMAVIGDQFGTLEIFLPELLTAAETAKTVSAEAIQPALRDMQAGLDLKTGRVVIGSVKGDIHTIGKEMVALMLEVNGFEVIDLGVDVASREFIDRSLESKADIVGLSSLMTTSMPYMREVVELRDALGCRDKFSVIVGGAPVTPEYCKEIGADAFGSDASDAVRKCNELVKNQRS